LRDYRVGANGGAAVAIRAALRPGRRTAWVAPIVPAVLVTWYLAWGAWVSVRTPRWLAISHVWWRVLLRPGDNRVILVVVALWLATLACYGWPRRLQPRTVGLAFVAGMVLIGGFLGTAALAPCRGNQTGASVAAAVLDLYVGQPAAYPPKGPPVCPGQPSLALQLASAVCLAATLVGALAAAAVLWRQPVGRLRARLVRDATVLVGLDAMTISLLRKLAEAGRPGGIVVIEPDADHPLLEEARATGARIMIANPASPQVLLPVLAGRRGCALRQLYALRPDVTENEEIAAAACGILRRYRPDPERQPHLVVRIDDPRHAGHWRGRHSGAADLWFEDALSAQEATASALVSQLAAAGARQLLLCGDSTLALAVLLELARRAWERRGLAQAAESGRRAYPQAAGFVPPGEPPAAQPVIERVVLLDQRADDLRREYLATAPQSMTAALPAVRVQRSPWKDHLLARLDSITAPEAAQTAVVVADHLTEGSMHEAGRVARLHPSIPVFVLSSDGSGTSEAIFDLLQPFQRALLVNGDPPEDTWTRIARHWHECYRLAHPVAEGPAQLAARRPWAELDDYLRQDNILQLRSVMAAVAARGRRWVPASAVPEGSFIELGRRDLAAVAEAEHTRWYLRRRAAGWRPPQLTGDAVGRDGRTRRGGRKAAGALVNSSVVPWSGLRAEQRAEQREYVRTQIDQLEDVGFMPVVPPGGPPAAVSCRRVGTVRARRLDAGLRWNCSSGSELSGRAGDWQVLDDHGDARTVRDPEFRASHAALGGDRWQRTGVFRAWPAGDEQAVRTFEGPAVARAGDWIVEGPGGERWPVADEQFRRGYEVIGPRAGGPGSSGPEASGR
jgi:hypothetical protein